MRKTKAEMEQIRRRVFDFIEVNPTWSIRAMAEKFGVSAATVSKWLDEEGYKRWRQ